MNRLRIAAAIVCAFAVAGLMVTPASAGQAVDVPIYSRAQPSLPNDALTSYASATAGTMRYTRPIDVRDAQAIYFYVTLSGNDATSVAGYQIEWLQEDFNDSDARFSSATDGYALTTGWSFLDTATSTNQTAAGDYVCSAVVRAPWCRLGFQGLLADDGDVLFRIAHALRYNQPYIAYQSDLEASDDLIVGDDATIGDDLAIYGDITQVDTINSTNIAAFTVPSGADITFAGSASQILGLDTLNTTNIAAFTVPSGGDVTFAGSASQILGLDTLNTTATVTSTLQVGGGTTLYSIQATSATISSGATSCTLTLPAAYVPAQHIITYSIVPATGVDTFYDGHGDSWFRLESDLTTCEVETASATTKCALNVHLIMRAKY